MAKPALAALALLAFVAPARADEPAPLAVAPPAQLVGNGRTVVPIVVTGGALAGTKALPVADVAWVTCTGATALAATPDAPPGVLAPAVTAPATLACMAHQNTVEVAFRIAVKPPPPGLYAGAVESDVRSTAKEVTLDAFSWDGKVRGSAAGLRTAATEGNVSVRGDRLVVTLAGNAPRVVAVALASGNQIGAAFVPITGVTTIPVESEPGASVQVWIAGRWFGPVKTKGRIAKIAIDVPPGITHGVARSTGRAGYVTDAITDLKIPALPRIAAVVNRAKVRVQEPATIAVAIAGPDGRPAAMSLKVSASAKRGTVGVAKALGPGVWAVPYTGPKAPGSEQVTILVDGDPRAGTAKLDLDIAAGNVARLELEVPPGPYEPGSEIAGTARAFDASGNPVLDAAVTASLGGAPLEVTPGPPITIRGRVPARLPDGELVLEVAAAGVRQRATVKAGGAAITATVGATIDGREAIAELAIRDRFGNLAAEGSFEVTVDGGTLGRLERRDRSYRAAVIADAGGGRARIVVRAGGRVLAEHAVRFEPPPEAFVLGAWASGGWTDNLGVLAGPRGGVGLVLRRQVSGLELAVLGGLDAMRFRDTTRFEIDEVMVDADRSIVSLGVQASVRARLRVSRRLGLAVAAGIVPMRAHVEFDAGAQIMEAYDEAVLGLRAQLHLDVRLGPGRAFAGATYGRARLADGVVVGRIDGASVVAGYEWWFADFGW